MRRKRGKREPVCWHCMIERGATFEALCRIDYECLKTGRYMPMCFMSDGSIVLNPAYGWGVA